MKPEASPPGPPLEPPLAPPLEVDPVRAAAWVEAGVPVFDVRPAAERQLGTVRGAECCDPDAPDPNQGLPPRDAPFLLYCAVGQRSLERARALRASGYGRVSSIRGGFQGWRTLGLPVDYPCGLGGRESVRYARQIVLPQVGAEGQARLARARVLLVGAGGLGSPAALYLAGAGVGSLCIVDGDVVERSNLHRQILHDDGGVGRRKVDSARDRLRSLNPDIEVRCRAGRIGEGNAREWIEGWDLVVDGSDNAPTRHAVNDACVRLGVPLVYGAVTAFEGQVSLFHPAADPGVLPCYACVFPMDRTPPAADCATAGVLGAMPGLVGTLQALEALKWLLGAGRPLLGELLLVDALNADFRKLALRADPRCAVCGGAAPA